MPTGIPPRSTVSLPAAPVLASVCCSGISPAFSHTRFQPRPAPGPQRSAAGTERSCISGFPPHFHFLSAMKINILSSCYEDKHPFSGKKKETDTCAVSVPSMCGFPPFHTGIIFHSLPILSSLSRFPRCALSRSPRRAALPARRQMPPHPGDGCGSARNDLPLLF